MKINIKNEIKDILFNVQFESIINSEKTLKKDGVYCMDCIIAQRMLNKYSNKLLNVYNKWKKQKE